MTLNNFLLGISIVMTLITLIPDFTNYLMQNTYLAKLYIIILSILWTCINKYLGVTFVLLLLISPMILNRNIENFDINPSSNNIDNDLNKDKYNENKKSKNNSQEPKINVVTSSKDTSSNTQTQTQNQAVEGFDLSTAEDTIKRGKQSNSIPVDQLVSQSTNDILSPYERGQFSESYTYF